MSYALGIFRQFVIFLIYIFISCRHNTPYEAPFSLATKVCMILFTLSVCCPFYIFITFVDGKKNMFTNVTWYVFVYTCKPFALYLNTDEEVFTAEMFVWFNFGSY